VVNYWPSLAVHNYIDRIHFGRAFPRLHRRLDKPVFYLGRRHRELFHDLATACFIARKTYPDDPKAPYSAMLHIHYDALCSWDPVYKKYLEHLAKLDKQRRKASTRKIKKKKDDFESLIRLMKFLSRLKSRRYHA
jgi:hypothetical protein